MFIAMNRFKVVKGEAKAFEDMWLNRESHLDKVPGFVEFHMLKGPERDDHTLYSSHTVWSDRDSFGAWTTSEQFRSAHGGAGSTRQMYLGHPEFEGFEVIQTIGGAKRAAAE